MSNLVEGLVTKPECECSPTEKHAFMTSCNCDWCGRGAVIVNGEILYVPSLKQAEYHEATAKNVLFYGGRGSGKSLCGRWDAHIRALAYPGFKYCILRKHYPELEKSHLLDIPREMKLLGGEWNGTSKIARYPNGSTGFFSHCNNEVDALNLLSAEFHLMFFDEVSTFDWETFRKLASSVRVPKHLLAKGVKPLVRAATNPLGVSAEMIDKYWVKKDAEEDDPKYKAKNWISIKANLEDNPYLPEDYKEQFSGMADHIIKAWVDGDFSMENALFDMKPKTPDGRPWHVIQEIDLEKILRVATIYRAIDAGWFPDPTVCLWIAHLGNRHIVFHERTWFKTTADEIAKDIKEEDERLGVKRVAITYCDPSMDINTTADIRTIKEIYETNGLAMENSINNREMYATVLHNALAEQAGDGLPRIQFYNEGRRGCYYLVKTIPQMRYHPTKRKAMDDHKQDHWVVALCYYLLSHSADIRSEMPSLSNRLRRWMLPKQPDRPRTY